MRCNSKRFCRFRSYSRNVHVRTSGLPALLDSQAPTRLDLTIASLKPIHALLNKITCDIHGHRVRSPVPARAIQRVTEAVEHGPGLHQTRSFASEVFERIRVCREILHPRVA